MRLREAHDEGRHSETGRGRSGWRLSAGSGGCQLRDNGRTFVGRQRAIALPANTIATESERRYSPAPTITIGMVGVDDPCSGSMVMANAFGSTPTGSGGLITAALPRTSGLNTPAGTGAFPLAGISHSS